MAGNKSTMASGRGGRLAGLLAETARWSAAAARQHTAAGLSTAFAWRRATLELVFPGACVSCGAELDPCDSPGTDLPLCSGCHGQLELLGEPTCGRCGAPVPKRSAHATEYSENKAQLSGCYRCRGRKLWFDAAVAAGLYSGLLRQLLLRMKCSAGDPISLAMGRLLWQQCGDRLAGAGAHVVVAVPLHWRRRLAHGTNSAAILAEVVAARLRLPLAEGLLRRRRHTPRQFDVSPSQRWHNLRRAFSVRAGYHLRDAHVLLVDDILTTGATCSEAARALRHAGAGRVTVVVVARAIGEFTSNRNCDRAVSPGGRAEAGFHASGHQGEHPL